MGYVQSSRLGVVGGQNREVDRIFWIVKPGGDDLGVAVEDVGEHGEGIKGGSGMGDGRDHGSRVVWV